MKKRNFNRWVLKTIFFNVPINDEDEYIRRVFASPIEAELQTYRLLAAGWESVYLGFNLFGESIIWFKHKRFY